MAITRIAANTHAEYEAQLGAFPNRSWVQTMHRAVLMTVVPCPIRRMDREMHTVRTISICKTAMADKFCCYSSHGRLQALRWATQPSNS